MAKKRKDRKRPRRDQRTQLAETRKVGKQYEPDDYLSSHISWRFSRMDRGGDWGYEQINTNNAWEDVFQKLQNFDSMTWDALLKDLRGRSRGNANHEVPREMLSKKARDRLNRIGRLDIEEVFSLRLTNKGRIFGVRNGSVLEILWYDPKHEVCPSTKRNI